ncbi:Uncharacterised protein [Vibrio cholerae]|nr:Uncharacterised protein [Vibrio cholerae]
MRKLCETTSTPKASLRFTPKLYCSAVAATNWIKLSSERSTVATPAN